MTRAYQGRALSSPWYAVSVSRVVAALCVAAVIAFGLWLVTLAPYLSNLSR